MWKELNERLAETVAQAQRSIVQIRNGRYGAGTGIVVHETGLIVTNAHVLHKRYPHVTMADGHTLRAQIIGYDVEDDLAALAVEATALPALPLGDSRAARPGDLVQAVGHPWGLVGAATTGVLVDRDAGWLSAGQPPRDWLIADLHLWPGNSGGPLLDAAGRLLGINTMLISGGLGVALPTHRVRAFLSRALVDNEPFAKELAGSTGYLMEDEHHPL